MLTSYLSGLGQATVATFWIPLFLWTVAALFLLVGLRIWGKRYPHIRYHAAMALLLSLPLGFAVMPLIEAGTTAAGITNMIPVGIGSEIPVLLESQIEGSVSVSGEVLDTKGVDVTEKAIITRTGDGVDGFTGARFDAPGGCGDESGWPRVVSEENWCTVPFSEQTKAGS